MTGVDMLAVARAANASRPIGPLLDCSLAMKSGIGIMEWIPATVAGDTPRRAWAASNRSWLIALSWGRNVTVAVAVMMEGSCTVQQSSNDASVGFLWVLPSNLGHGTGSLSINFVSENKVSTLYRNMESSILRNEWILNSAQLTTRIYNNSGESNHR